jgi:hypothetical protein
VKRALQTIGVVLLSFACSFADPTTGAAIVTAIGEVSVNGNPLPPSSPIFAGDRLATGTSSALMVSLQGSSVRIGPSSHALYRGAILELLSGAVDIRGREVVVSGSFTVTPLRQSQFSVQRASTRTSLHLLSGTLKLSRGKESTIIAAPADYNLQDDQPIPAAKAGSGTRVLPLAAGAAAGASVVISHWLTNKETTSATSTCVSGKSPTSCK